MNKEKQFTSELMFEEDKIMPIKMIPLAMYDKLQVLECAVLCLLGTLVYMHPEQSLFMYTLVAYSALFFVDSLYVLYKGLYDRYGDYTKSSAVVYAFRAFCGISLSLLDKDMAAMMIVVSVIVDVSMHRHAHKRRLEENGAQLQ